MQADWHAAPHHRSSHDLHRHRHQAAGGAALPAAGEVARAVRADAGPRHPRHQRDRPASGDFIFYTVGVFLETVLPVTAITAVIVRTIVIISAFEFYIGFILPEMIKKFFIKDII